jgi:hypothetical protein
MIKITITTFNPEKTEIIFCSESFLLPGIKKQ